MPRAPARLILPKAVMKRLESAGVYCQTWVTVERQARANGLVLRGVESGGGTGELGRYISFFSPAGERIGWLQRLDRIAPNGVHAVVIAPELLSVEMARVGQTYQLLVVRHGIGQPADGRRPPVDSSILFRGIDGHLSPELLTQGLAPEFFTRAGEVKAIPGHLSEAVKAVTAGVSCVNCRHCHGLVGNSPVSAPQPEAVDPPAGSS